MVASVSVGPLELAGGGPLFLIGGPCVIEDPAMIIEVAQELKAVTAELGIPYIFKASYDKANRTSISSYRGPGLKEGLKLLEAVRSKVDVPILSDVHSAEEATIAGEVLDVLQIPAFLSRQTDILVAAAHTGKVVNVKKGQFAAPSDLIHVVGKLRESGCENILLTDRGASFGYGNLVSDMRAIPIMRETGCPVVYDATHSVQMPGGAGATSSGDRRFIPFLSRAAVAAGADGLFMEIHPDPDCAKSDGPNQVPLAKIKPLLQSLIAVRKAIQPYLTGLVPL
jgi:2-dehydro-3-deoxyphosphooctonate aldolase (KDO 8-P synthase)